MLLGSRMAEEKKSAVEQQMEKLTGAVAALVTKAAEKPAVVTEAKVEKTYTRTELTDSVARGQITQAQADAILDQQLEKKVIAGAEKAATGPPLPEI